MALTPTKQVLGYIEPPEDAPEPTEDFDNVDNPTDEAEQFGLPQSLLDALGITSDEEWDEIPLADLDAMKAQNTSR